MIPWSDLAMFLVGSGLGFVLGVNVFYKRGWRIGFMRGLAAAADAMEKDEERHDG